MINGALLIGERAEIVGEAYTHTHTHQRSARSILATVEAVHLNCELLRDVGVFFFSYDVAPIDIYEEDGIGQP